MSMQPSKKVVRIALTEESSNRLNKWLNEVNTDISGPRIKQKQLVEWLVLSRPESLSRTDIQNIREKFIDDVDLAEWALRKIKAAKQQGHSLRLSELVPTARTPKKRSSRKPDAQGATKAESTPTNPSEN